MKWIGYEVKIMHPESLELIGNMLLRYEERYPDKKVVKVLDVGSLDVNGTFRPLVEKRGWKYTGLDVREGKNVDVVAEDPYSYPFKANAFDIVLSGSTMEHVAAIWRWVPELARLIKPGGMLALHTHWNFKEHRHPVDCWRVLPDGMRFLFDECKTLVDYEIWIANGSDIAAYAWKTDGRPTTADR